MVVKVSITDLDDGDDADLPGAYLPAKLMADEGSVKFLISKIGDYVINRLSAGEFTGMTVMVGTDALETALQTLRAPIFGGRKRPFLGRNRRALIGGGVKTDYYNNSTGGYDALSDVATTDAFVGTTAVQWSVSSATSTKRVFPAAAFDPIDCRNGSIGIWFKPISNLGGINNIDLRLYDSGSPASPAADYLKVKGANTFGFGVTTFKGLATALTGEGLWQRFIMPTAQLEALGAGADLSAITNIQLGISGAQVTPTVLQTGLIEFIPAAFSKAKVCFTFDDGYNLPWTMDLMNRSGIPVTLFPGRFANQINTILPESMSPQMMKNYHDFAGTQIGSQSWLSELATDIDPLNEEESTIYFQKIFVLAAAMGLTGVEDGSYFTTVGPSDIGAFTKFFRKFFRSVRRFDGGLSSGDPAPYGEMFPFGDPMRYRALSVESYSTHATPGDMLVAHVQQAIDNGGGCAVFADHKAAEAGSTNYLTMRSAYQQVIDFVNDNRDVVDVCTIDDLHRQANA